jgi:crotonobetainyl-CoA:carnitine CoA-transferase CaiB-like acyl-CoA transferase
MSDETILPLSGVTVIDFTQVFMGPCATQMLGDYGADVIKIEKVGTGDLSRTSLPGDPAGLQNPVFRSLNRNKRSIALDLKSEVGKDIVRKLVAQADVMVNNFRAGVMERMGFGYEEMAKINPRIIHATGTGFGIEGPYAHKGGQDVLAQALTGLMHRRSTTTDPLSVYPTTLADYSAGMHLVQAILFALLQRDRTGQGQKVYVSLYDSVLAMQMQEAAMWLMRGVELNWGALPLTGVFETSDGAVALVGGTFKPNPLRDICIALEMDDLSAIERFSTFAKMVRNKAELQSRLRARFAQGTTARWIAGLEAQDMLCAPVRSMAAALEDPQTTINHMILQAETGGEQLKVTGSPVHLTHGRLAVRRMPPTLGEHSDEILAELGYDETARADARRSGAVA